MNPVETLYKLAIRSHPEKNPKIDMFSRLHELAQKYPNQLYISFRDLNKLGINPHSSYNTPNGIYTYPLQYALDNSLSVPYTGDQPYTNIHVIRIKPEYMDKIVFISQYEDERDDLDQLFNYLRKIERGGVASYLEREADLIIAKTPGRKCRFSYLWGTTYHMAQKLQKNNRPQDIWNFLFRKVLGYYGVVDDRGYGIIYSTEPTQAVFFSVEPLQQLEVVFKTRSGEERKRLGNAAIVYKQLVSIYYRILKTLKQQKFEIQQHYLQSLSQMIEVDTGMKGTLEFRLWGNRLVALELFVSTRRQEKDTYFPKYNDIDPNKAMIYIIYQDRNTSQTYKHLLSDPDVSETIISWLRNRIEEVRKIWEGDRKQQIPKGFGLPESWQPNTPKVK